MNEYKRNGYKWGVNEILSLQREFELLNWSIDEMALKHKRTPNAIMSKLDQEGFADYNVLYSSYHELTQMKAVDVTNWLASTKNINQQMSVNETQKYDLSFEVEDVDETTDLSNRVNVLEGAVYEIKSMVQQMMNSMSKSQNLKSYL